MHTETIVLDPDRKDVTLTALCWDPSPALQDASRPRPGLLILPGGGYQSHAHREMDPIALRFAAMGYHTFILRYSLMRPDGACLHPQPLIDVARAMCLLRERAQAWCMDPERIGVCGFSAGGHLALMYAVSHAQPWLQEAAGLLDSVDSPLQAEEILREKLPSLLQSARETVQNCGKEQEISGGFCTEYFPTRTYTDREGKTYTLPAGTYRSLTIRIGEAEGHNWWCVMFPSLCLPAVSENVESSFTQEENDLIQTDETDYRFRVWEWTQQAIQWVQEWQW